MISPESQALPACDQASLQSETVLGAGRGGLILAIAGSGWLSWGLVESHAFTGAVGPVFGCLVLLLIAGSIYTIRNGRLLRRKYPPLPSLLQRRIRTSFLIVFGAEIVGVVLVVALGNRLHRPDLAAAWCAIIVGLHFVPLAKIFKAPALGVLGIAILLWSVLCWVVFPKSILVLVALGTGALLWMTCVFALLRAGTMCRSLAAS